MFSTFILGQYMWRDLISGLRSSYMRKHMLYLSVPRLAAVGGSDRGSSSKSSRKNTTGNRADGWPMTRGARSSYLEHVGFPTDNTSTVTTTEAADYVGHVWILCVKYELNFGSF